MRNVCLDSTESNAKTQKLSLCWAAFLRKNAKVSNLDLGKMVLTRKYTKILKTRKRKNRENDCLDVLLT